MSDDNIVSFPGADAAQESEPRKRTRITADELLLAIAGRFEDVIVIGIAEDGSQCISSIDVDEAIFHLSRAIHRLHTNMDEAQRV